MRESGIEREGKDMNLDVLVNSVLYVCFFTNSPQPPRRPLRQRSQKSRRNPPPEGRSNPGQPPQKSPSPTSPRNRSPSPLSCPKSMNFFGLYGDLIGLFVLAFN